MNRSYVHSRDGFVSLYFLGILIYVSSLLMVLISNDIKRLTTITNLKRDQEYFSQEANIIHCIKSDLEEWQEEEELEISGVDGLTITDSTIEVYIFEPLEEYIIITYDKNQKKIIDYQVNRYIDEK